MKSLATFYEPPEFNGCFEKEAYDQGWIAASIGKTLNDNPHTLSHHERDSTPGDRQNYQWDRGFEAYKEMQSEILKASGNVKLNIPIGDGTLDTSPRATPTPRYSISGAKITVGTQMSDRDALVHLVAGIYPAERRIRTRSGTYEMTAVILLEESLTLATKALKDITAAAAGDKT
jgi:hypothetical protein